MTAHIIRTQRAWKAHDCIGGDTIKPGERYVAEMVPPWTPSKDDPDRPTVPLGRWLVARYHRSCWGPDPYL